jgi:hypothetical protein
MEYFPTSSLVPRLLKPASRVERVAISEYINHVIGCDGINVQINKCSGSTSRQRGWQNLHPRDFSRMSHQILRMIFNLEMVFTKHICEWLTQVLGSGSGPAISKSKLLRLSSHGCIMVCRKGHARSYNLNFCSHEIQFESVSTFISCISANYAVWFFGLSNHPRATQCKLSMLFSESMDIMRHLKTGRV